MHDLVHDLAGDILKSKLFDLKRVGGENLSQVRYFGWDSPSDQIDKIKEPGRLCTLFLKSNISVDMLLSFQFLKVLILPGSCIEELSASISKLIYLRYLDLSYTKIKVLPNSICKLYNLQTFRVKNCPLLGELMGNMISLRHICYSQCWIPVEFEERFISEDFQMPLKMVQLTCLQTLQFFKVGLEKEELGHLKNLRGELMIRGLQLVCNKEEAGRAYLQEKSNIYKLAYLWSHDEPEGCETNYEHVLDGLQPHPNLKTLVVKNYLGARFPSWFSEELLPNLKLSGCRKCEEIPSLGQLKLLRHLELIGFHELECTGSTFDGVDVNNNGSSNNNTNIQVFPSLKELLLKDMPSLIEWIKALVSFPLHFGEMPSLSYLNISQCPKLDSVPTGGLHRLTGLRELHIGPVKNTKNTRETEE